ncbi:MAG: glycoside hydrolase family 2 [Lachnospiraceae bacterium]|nr:glycoside hydrolase family 2 [Lachnospiraceae bacterium]
MNCYKKDYPRPQFVRDQWEDLNGEWAFAFDDENVGIAEKWYLGFDSDRSIKVPFSYETEISGIGDETVHENIWYQRKIGADAEKLRDKRYILHFEGCDYICRVWVNGAFAGLHKGGYTRFSLDISEYLNDGENLLVVKAEDSLSSQQPRGKQRWISESFECWYVQTTGIWKSVWSEYVPETSLARVKMTPDLTSFKLGIEFDLNLPSGADAAGLTIETDVTFKGTKVTRVVTDVTNAYVKAWADMSMPYNRNHYYDGPVWTPETPDMYDIVFRLVKDGVVLDEVGSYAAMREIRIDGHSILLNGKLLYQKLILNQSYWKESHLTPPDEKAIVADIDATIAMGFNGLRLHQKNEDERFYYWCDVKGMLVWCEAPSAYRFTDNATQEFLAEWLEQVRQNYNHPCIITWVPVNESWGVNKVQVSRPQQHFTEAVYHATKMLDPTRPVIVNDGWVHTISDIITLHDYDGDGERILERYGSEDPDHLMNGKVYFNRSYPVFAEGFEYKGQPVIISEFGGIAINGEKGWGYGEKAGTAEEYRRRLEDIVSAMKKLKYCCGYCYTQLTDVQQEINGLMTTERKYKVAPEIVEKINKKPVNPMYKP